ncbi:MAG: HIT domain-containing protein [Candidatus Aenigmarchaeota archaeon]|nr:HIT domain-containing protein [Candidatus Aenigmarchaeota archaeon]
MEEQCIFCSIVEGKIPAAIIHEDDVGLAFLDITPATKGHTVLISKEHYEDIFSVPSEKLEKLIVFAKGLMEHIKEKLSAQGFNMESFIGSASGSMIKHFSFHLIPRYDDDGQERPFATRMKFGSKEELTKYLEETAEKITE